MSRFPNRLSRAAEAAGSVGLEALAISPSPDFAYLAGYRPPPLERLTLLVIRSGVDPILLVPELEAALARGSPVGQGAEVVAWTDGDDPYAAAASLLPHGGSVGLSGRMWASHVLRLQDAAPRLRFRPASDALDALRAVKDSEELATLRRAGSRADETFRLICAMPFEGRREREVASDIARLLVEAGHDRADFTIVASGPNGASPHHEPGTRKIDPGDGVVLDFGGEIAGYFSDTTRTVVVREPPEDFPQVYGVVREAEDAAFRAVRPGVAAEDVDRAARDVIREASFGDRFIHRTGHGIGLEVHEAPYIVKGNTAPLEAGMTFSIEPGVYLEGRFGVRIEDIVAVTDDGAERLNNSTRDLQVL